MPTPVPELIAIEIEARLNDVLRANGYAFDLSEVVRPSRKGENWQRKHRGVGIIQGDSERAEELDCPGNPPANAWRVTFELQCVTRDSMNSEDAHATAENDMASAVVKGITSVAQWHTMGGYAVDSTIGGMVPFVSPEGEMDGVMVPVVVTYRVSETNPFEVRA